MKPRITRLWAKDLQWGYYRDGKRIAMPDIWQVQIKYPNLVKYVLDGKSWRCLYCKTFQEACRAAKAIMEREGL